jgi:hypothetical protein
LDLNIGPPVIGETFVMEEGFGLGVGGDEVGEAEGGVVGGYFEGGEEVWDGGGVHVASLNCR